LTKTVGHAKKKAKVLCPALSNAVYPGVVFPGESWDVDDLLVCDASVFPTASGANPMPTTLALAHLISTRLAARLKQGADKAASHGGEEQRRKERRGKAEAAQASAALKASATKWVLAGAAVAGVVYGMRFRSRR
jgi:hypothetical protein